MVGSKGEGRWVVVMVGGLLGFGINGGLRRRVLVVGDWGCG
jgi:hypothetical protein